MFLLHFAFLTATAAPFQLMSGVVGSTDGELYVMTDSGVSAYDFDGKQRWHSTLAARPLAVHGKYVLVHTERDEHSKMHVMLLNRKNGKRAADCPSFELPSWSAGIGEQFVGAGRLDQRRGLGSVVEPDLVYERCTTDGGSAQSRGATRFWHGEMRWKHVGAPGGVRAILPVEDPLQL